MPFRGFSYIALTEDRWRGTRLGRRECCAERAERYPDDAGRAERATRHGGRVGDRQHAWGQHASIWAELLRNRCETRGAVCMSAARGVGSLGSFSAGAPGGALEAEAGAAGSHNPPTRPCVFAAWGWWRAQGWVPPRSGFAWVWAWVRIGSTTPFAIDMSERERAAQYSRRTDGAERASAVESVVQSEQSDAQTVRGDQSEPRGM